MQIYLVGNLGCKYIYDVFNNHISSASHMVPGPNFENVSCKPFFKIDYVTAKLYYFRSCCVPHMVPQATKILTVTLHSLQQLLQAYQCTKAYILWCNSV